MAKEDVMLVSEKEIDRYLLGQGVSVSVPGVDSPSDTLTLFLIKRKIKTEGWSEGRKSIAVQQLMFKDAGAAPGTIDGLVGPGTRNALEQWQNLIRDVEVSKKVVKAIGMSSWPREKDVEKFYGKAGTGLIMMDLPYPMKIAWDLDEVVTKITIHGKCADSAHRVLTKALAHYGLPALKRLGLDLFGGCIANPPRFKRGSKSSPSTHNYGIAIDFDPERNQLRWGRDRANLAKPSAMKWWEMWEEEGWISLGRERNYDWMHIQAANL